MNPSVTCSFLTHNHVEAMTEILDRCLELYARYDIDICVYDDSDNDLTKESVNRFIQNGATNLYYIDAHNATCGDHKYLLVAQGYNLPKEYDYIWPCKDRVCFDEPFISKLRQAVNEGPDAVLGAYEFARWDVGENLTKDTFTDPAELYRLYAVVSTNWECLIRKRETMLAPINWEDYAAKYNVGENNSFNQTVSFFVRLSEMDSCSVKICRYTEERFISSKASSAWGDKTFEVWIDRWVTVNFSLPSVYDRYKAEAIKSQTNLSELFGSVENMISLHQKGLFTEEVFEKYKNIWSFVSNIPVSYLEAISKGDEAVALRGTVSDFERSFTDHDFKKAWWLIAANTFLSQVYDDRTYRILVGCFNQYRSDMMKTGRSNMFNGISSLGDLMERYSYVQ